LGNVEVLPTEEDIDAYAALSGIKELLGTDKSEMRIHLKAKQLLDEGNVNEAWKVLLMKF